MLERKKDSLSVVGERKGGTGHLRLDNKEGLIGVNQKLRVRSLY